jgi:hypothetical protein
MVLPVNLFKNSLILVWCFYINLHAEISEPLQHYLFRLFLIRSSTTRESLLGASSFYLILFSTVVWRKEAWNSNSKHFVHAESSCKTFQKIFSDTPFPLAIKVNFIRRSDSTKSSIFKNHVQFLPQLVDLILDHLCRVPTSAKLLRPKSYLK